MKYFILTTILFFYLIQLNGCMMMHGGMMGKSHSSHTQAEDNVKPIVKDATIGDYHLVAEFPSLVQHSETKFSLKIILPNESLWTNAHVRIKISEGKENEIDEVLSPSNEGKYEYSFPVHEKGLYTIAFVVEQLDESLLKMPIILSSEQTVQEMKHKNTGDNETSLWYYVGGVAMVVMMGRIF